MRCQLYRRLDGQWDWRIVAANGEIVATSGGQGFTERNDAKEAVERLWEEMARGNLEFINA